MTISSHTSDENHKINGFSLMVMGWKLLSGQIAAESLMSSPWAKRVRLAVKNKIGPFQVQFFLLVAYLKKKKKTAEQVDAHNQACDLDLSRANYMGRQRTVPTRGEQIWELCTYKGWTDLTTVYLRGVNRPDNCVLTKSEQSWQLYTYKGWTELTTVYLQGVNRAENCALTRGEQTWELST